MIGQTISHYRITGQLGAGGMGVVYEAVDTRLDRTVALKFLPPESTRDPAAKARFIHEAKAASALDHPNVCTVYEIDETEDGRLFLAMACYQGEPLNERIARGPLPLDEAMDITRQIAEGLARAHERDIIHRDIKPANIFLTSGGPAKILDFGLAKLEGQTAITQPGAMLGTVNYMSPEQARGEDAGARSDLWSLGVVLYEMVTGRPPFRGDQNQAAVFAILNEEPEPPTAVRTGVPMELERLVVRCLEKDPRARYQTAEDLASDLHRVRRVCDSAHQPTVALPGRPRSRPRRPRPLAVAGGVLAAVLVLGAFLIGLNVGNLRERLAGPDGESPIRSLAVLPFANLSGDEEQVYFVDGMHEALITELSKVGSLKVISRTSAMHYQGTNKPMTQIARELDVAALVEGSVLRVGDQVRITAQLIHGTTDEHLWADDYDRELKDILGLLSEVARAITKEIDVALTPEQQRRLTTERTVDPDVYETMLRGRYHLFKFTVEGALEARRYFQQAIAADSTCAEGHAGLSASYIIYSVIGAAPPGEVIPQARKAARRALELDPELGVAHTNLGYIKLYFDWDLVAAEREFGLALAFDPGEGNAMHGLADCMTARGRMEEAVDLVKRSRQFDPYSYIRYVSVWAHLALAGHYEESIAEIEQWRAFSGNGQAGWWHSMKANFRLGREELAMAELRKSAISGDPEWAPVMEKAYVDSGLVGAFRVCADRLAGLSLSEYIDPLNIAVYFAWAGDTEQTFRWLEKAFEERRPSMLHMIMQPALDPYRADPRFRDLLGRMGIPEAGWERLGSVGG